MLAQRGGKQAWRDSGTGQEPKTDEAQPSAVDTVDSALAPVEVYTQTHMVFGLVATEGRRLSDILNSNSTLAIRDTTTTALFDGMEAGSPTYGTTGDNPGVG